MHLLCDAFPEARGGATLTIACLGNRWRGDDAAGLEVAGRLRATLPEGVVLVEHEGEPTALIDRWDDAERLWLVDAVSSGAEPGTLHRLDVGGRALPADLFRASTHHVSLAEAVELARALGRLPARTVVLGIEGESFGVGESLTPRVSEAVGRAADAITEEVAACTRRL